jgi:sulfite exporter TauE/SafE
VVGLLTTLLPCGWRYAFAVTAAGSGSPWLGALTMSVFWLGTLPIMLMLGMGVQALTGALRPHLPVLASLIIVGVGTWTVLGRMNLPQIELQCAADISGIEDAASQVKSLDSKEMPCCHAN